VPQPSFTSVSCARLSSTSSGDGDGPTLGDPEQRKPIDARSLYHRLKVLNKCVERRILDVPIRKTIAALTLVVANESVIAGKLRQQVTPD
jgi:hypothetical protein